MYRKYNWTGHLNSVYLMTLHWVFCMMIPQLSVAVYQTLVQSMTTYHNIEYIATHNQQSPYAQPVYMHSQCTTAAAD